MNKTIKKMFELQDNLNKDTNGENWKEGVTKEGRIINWERAIYLELAECIESYPWKHWKGLNVSPDFNNMKIELVDIWHFLMSSIMEMENLIKNDLDKEFFNKNINEILNVENNLNSVSYKVSYDGFKTIGCNGIQFKNPHFKNWDSSLLKDIDNSLLNYETLIKKAIQIIDIKYVLKNNLEVEQLNNIIVEEFNLIHKDKIDFRLLTLLYCEFIFDFFIEMFNLGMDLEELNTLYIGKNLLNKFRQDNGYKEGTYIKMWNGVEDNVIMTKVINDNVNASFEELYSLLEKEYQKIK